MAEKNTEADGSAVIRALNIANRHGLSVEVVLTALYEARENPEVTITQIMENTLDEWDINY